MWATSRASRYTCHSCSYLQPDLIQVIPENIPSLFQTEWTPVVMQNSYFLTPNCRVKYKCFGGFTCNGHMVGRRRERKRGETNRFCRLLLLSWSGPRWWLLCDRHALSLLPIKQWKKIVKNETNCTVFPLFLKLHCGNVKCELPQVTKKSIEDAHCYQNSLFFIHSGQTAYICLTTNTTNLWCLVQGLGCFSGVLQVLFNAKIWGRLKAVGSVYTLFST